MSKASELLAQIIDGTRNSERSQQKELGPSEVGGCRRKTWHKLNDTPITNENTMIFPAFMGTAIHKGLEGELAKLKGNHETEIEVEGLGLKGHIDLYLPEEKEVIDWKTKKLSNAAYFPNKQQQWQVQLYANLLIENGRECDVVTLVGIPRDGDERDILLHSEPYDANKAAQALEWLEDVKSRKESPAPERDASYCSLYCSYYDPLEIEGCAGMRKEHIEQTIIEDEVVAQAAEDYVSLSIAIRDLERRRDGIKATLAGISGVTPNGTKVVWQQVAGAERVDKEAVEKALGYVPMKRGEGFTKLVVKNA